MLAIYLQYRYLIDTRRDNRSYDRRLLNSQVITIKVQCIFRCVVLRLHVLHLYYLSLSPNKEEKYGSIHK